MLDEKDATQDVVMRLKVGSVYCRRDAINATLSAHEHCVAFFLPTLTNGRERYSAAALGISRPIVAALIEIEEERKAGGLAGLMHVLSTFDLGSIDIYDVPKTEALLDQKRESFAPYVQWWSECLMDGRIRCDYDSI